MLTTLFNYDVIEKVFRKKNYSFLRRSFELNLVGIRTTLFPQPNKFDDIFAVVYKDAFGLYSSYCVNCTTDPGFYWLQNPMNVKGTAILKPGQYENVWKIGLHNNYDALVQVGKFTVYRDNNKNTTLDLDPSTLETGYFGINLHRASATGTSTDVNVWSAGCQVIANIAEYLEIMKLCRLASNKDKLFNYTLLEESDFV